MRPIYIFIFCWVTFVTISWTNNTTKYNSEKQAVEKAALSFYEWYLPTVHKLDNENYPFTVELIENGKGKYRLDYTAYFNELGKLGTISDKFLQVEKERFSYVEEYLSSDKYYEEIESYNDAYNDFVDDFYYYRMSQDIDFGGVKVISTQISSDQPTACVEIMLTTTETGIDNNPRAQILLEKENNSWMIVKIIPLI
ncbi:MAG: hypothetical protein E6772_05470 [Dysgonomonas sp.]|nr:hypothetical protein [Dysgonomonas sp.]